MISVMDFVSIIFYIALIVLIVVLIILAIRAIQTLNKVDKTLDDINIKSSKLDGVFNIIVGATDAVVGLSDTLVSALANGIEKLFRKKVKKDE